jgi:hypothetical protein
VPAKIFISSLFSIACYNFIMTNKDKQLTEIKAYREKIEKHYNTIKKRNY